MCVGIHIQLVSESSAYITRNYEESFKITHDFSNISGGSFHKRK